MNEVIGYVDTRAAEVATDAIASDVAQVHQDMLDADADASAAAASAAAAAGTLANAVKKTGESSQTVEGDITMSTGDLGVAGDVGVQGQLSVLGGCDLRAPVTVPAPVNNTDAATKKYVDDSLDNYATMVRTATEQTIADPKHFVNYVDGCNTGKYLGIASGTLVGSRSGYVELATIKLVSNKGVRFMVLGGANNTGYCEAVYTLIKGGGSPVLRCVYKTFTSANLKPDLWIYEDGDTVRIYGIRLQYAHQVITALCYFDYGQIQSLPTNELVLTENPGVEVTLPAGAVQEVYLQRDS